MKIAVCYSGAIPDVDVENNIMQMKKILPNADYFFTTWTDQPNHSFINKRYNPPKMKYNAGYRTMKNDIETLRGIRNNDPEIVKRFEEFVANSVNTYEQELHTLEKNTKLEKRHWYKLQQRQHIIHALTCRDFVDPNVYDIVIRMRYDTTFDPDIMREWLPNFCDMCYELRRPIGFHRYPQTAQQLHSTTPIFELSHWPDHRNSNNIRDFMIIHRADMFDYKIVEHFIESKQLTWSEPAWYQILVKPYFTHPLTINLPVSLAKIDDFEIHQSKLEGHKQLSMLESVSWIF